MLRKELIDTALGKIKPDLIIKGGEIINVYTKETYQADIAIKNERIAFIGNAQRLSSPITKIVDAKGLYIAPGLIDAHLHVESSMLTIAEFAKLVIPHGTTTVIIDPHEIVSILGLKGISLIIDEVKKVPLKVFPLIPYNLKLKEAKDALLKKEILGTGELNWASIIAKNNDALKRIELAMKIGKISDGHITTNKIEELCAIVNGGLMSDHEGVTEEDAVNRLRLGIMLMIREGSAAKNVSSITKAILKKGLDTRRCCFCTDDKHAEDLIKEGHIDHAIRCAINEGLDPITAIQMATLNAAEYFNLDREVGSIAPGKKADLIFINDLKKLQVQTVMINGKVVAKNGKLLIKIEPYAYPKFAKKTIFIKRKIKPEDFKLKVKPSIQKVKANIIVAIDGQILTEHKVEELYVQNGEVKPNIEKDILKIAVIERRKATGKIGLGFVNNFGLKSGAIASSVAHDLHNIIVVGTNDEDMALAINTIAEKGGGQIAVKNGEVLALLELPIAGIISDKPANEVIAKIEKLHEVAKNLGSKLKSPFMTLSFLSLPIPKIKITEKGLLDVTKNKYINSILL